MDDLDFDYYSNKDSEKSSIISGKSSVIKESKFNRISSKTNPVLYEKPKLKKAEIRFKKYKRTLKSLKNFDTKMNCIFLNELTKVNNNNIKEEYNKDKASLDEKKFLNMIKFHNKIREIINCTDLNEIDKFIFQKDFETYNIQTEKENKNVANNNVVVVENNNQNNMNNKVDNKKKLNKIPPIKNFWKLSLINCQFFKINKIDGQILNFLRDIIIIPLEFPNFRLEFHFKQNEYLKQNILTKEYFYTNTKKEKLYISRGCDIEWGEDNMNPTLKELKKVVKDIKVQKKKTKTKVEKIKEETIYVNNDSFFRIFDIDKCTIEKDFVEANFFITDFFPNILEYYLNIMNIKYDNIEDELISNN